jgi:Fe2+ or Zn2+ uptake regulation protein
VQLVQQQTIDKKTNRDNAIAFDIINPECVHVNCSKLTQHLEQGTLREWALQATNVNPTSHRVSELNLNIYRILD